MDEESVHRLFLCFKLYFVRSMTNFHMSSSISHFSIQLRISAVP